jgi:peptide chain release factor subunit 1
MDMRNEIKKLARIGEGPYPFLSLYLNTKWDDEQQRERIRLFTKNQLKKGYDQLKGENHEEWRKAFMADQHQIEKYVEGLVRRVYHEEIKGLAIFSCSGLGTFLTYPSIIPYENEFFISDHPILQPLVQLSSQYQNTLMVIVETDSAELFEISLEGVLAESFIENYVPGRHDQGGWAQRRYQRHIKDHMDKHLKEVAQQLIELFDSGQWKRIVLIGQDRMIPNFKAFLPERVKQHIGDTFSINYSEERSKVIFHALERILDREREEVISQIQGITEKALKSGMAVLGLNGTLEAINKGQIHTLYLLTSFSLPGEKCLRCGSLSVPLPKGNPSVSCPLCKGETKSVDLGDEMMRSALRQDGEVKWVEEHPVLSENDGVGASLRFSLSR